MLHDVLARIGHKDELPRAVRQMVSRGVVPHAMAPDIMATLGRELERPEVSGPVFRIQALYDRASACHRHIRRRTPSTRPCGLDCRRPCRRDRLQERRGAPAAHRRQVAFYMNHLRKLGYKK